MLDNTTLCYKHNIILSNLKELKKKLYLDEEILFLIEQSINEIKMAKKDGQKMEKRLKQYVNKIESLGFKRIK